MIPAVLLAAVAVAQPLRHALVVGANDGGGVLEPLRYAERDAEAFADVITDLGRFPADRVTVLYAPDHDALQRAIAVHAAWAEAADEDLFLFYYSGHADARGLRLGQELYHYEALRQDLRAVDADVRVGMLDACRSGAITRLKGATLAPPLDVADERLAAEGEAWMTASSADELAQESDLLRGGFFTHYVISGMRGAADDGDGVVALDELYQYAHDRVVAHTGGTEAGAQHPHFDYQLSGAGSLMMTDLRTASASVVLPEDLAGEISVLRLPASTVVVELDKRPGTERVIALPAGRYLLRRRFGGGLTQVTVGLEAGSTAIADRWGAPITLEESELRGELPPSATEAFVADSERRMREQRIGSSPGLAGAMSTMIPGAGQLYNGQTLKGVLYFGGTASLLGSTYFTRVGEGGGQAVGMTMLGAALWGASIADAAYNVHRREDGPPEGGATLAFTARGDDTVPVRLGLTGELHVVRGLFIGLDQLGAGWDDRGRWDLHLGSRLRYELGHGVIRPSALVAAGIRTGDLGASQVTRPVFGFGLDARYHPVPRYFMAPELRYELDGVEHGAFFGLSAGLHLGR